MADTNSTTKFTADISQLRAEMQAASRLVRVATSEFKAATAGMDDWSSSADGLQAKLKQLNTVLESQKKQVSLAEKELEEVTKEYGENSAEADRARIKLNNLTAEVAKTEKQQESYEQQLEDVTSATKDVEDVTKEAGDGFSVMKGVLADLASTAIQAGIEALKDFAEYAIQAGSDFEAGMSKVQATSGANANEIAALTEKAKEMGSTTKFSATESAEAFNYMAMAGWDTQQMLDGIEGVMSLAAASGTDLAKTSDIVTDALTAMGYGAEDAGHFADVMASASSNANTNVEMMGETFQYVAPIAGAMGYSIEDTATAIGLMANAGIKGTKAGTSLRSIMSSLAAPPKAAADAMEELKISITTTTEDGEEVMLPFQDVVGQLRDKFSGLSEAEQTQAAKAIAGQEAMSGLLAIVNASDEDFEKLTTAINNSEGAAEAMATTMQDNLQGKLTELSSAAEGLGIALYDQVKGPLTSAVKVATGLIHGITDAITPQKTELERFIGDIKKSNAETRQSIENANNALDKGEADVKRIDALSEKIKKANEQFGIFAETDTSEVATDVSETAEGVGTSMDTITTSTGNVVKKLNALDGITFDDLQTAFDGTKKTISEDGSAISKTAGSTKESLDGIDNATFDNVPKNFKSAETSIKATSGEISGDIGTVSESIEGLNGEQVSMSGLTDGLKDVSIAAEDASGQMSEFEKAEIRYAIQELSKDIPALSDAWDDVTGTLKITEEEFDNLIDAQKRAIMESSLAKASAEVMDVVVQAELKHQQAADALEEALKDAGTAAGKTFGTVQEVWDEIEGGSSWSSAVTYDMAKAATAANDAYEETTATLDEAYEAQGRVDKAAKKLAEEWGFSTEAAKKSAEATEEAVEKTEEQVEAEHAAAEAAYEAQKKIAQAHKDAATEITDAYDQAKTAAESALSINPFEKWETDAEKGMSALQESLDSQVAGLTNYAANLEVVSEHVGKEITPEFLNYLEDLGTGGAQVVAELANAFASGDTESVDRLMKAYVDAMDIQDDIASKIAMDNIALQAGLGELSSTAEEWAGLDKAIEYIKGFGDEVSDEILASFLEAKEAALEAGIKIPEGLAEGIEKGSDDPNAALVDATKMLLEAITGQGEGLIHAAETAGISIPESIKSGILSGGDSAVSAYQSLLELIGASSTDAAERGGEEAGKTFSASTASGVEEKQDEVEEAATLVTDSAQEAALEAGAKFADAGSEAGESFGEGIESKRTDAADDAEDLALYAALQAKSDKFEEKGKGAGQEFADGINAMTNAAYYAGQNIAYSADSGMSSVSTYNTGTYFAQGFINGIASMVSSAMAQATTLATSSADAIDAALLISSPSKLTYETGRYFTEGFMNGVSSLTKNVVGTVKDLALSAAKALVNGTSKSVTISSDSINYVVKRLTYESGQKADEFTAEIERLNGARDLEVERLKNDGEARTKAIQDALEAEQERTSAAQEKINSEATAAITAANKKYQDEQKKEQTRTAAAQKQIQEEAERQSEESRKKYQEAQETEQTRTAAAQKKIKEKAEKKLAKEKEAYDKLVAKQEALLKEYVDAKNDAIEKAKNGKDGVLYDDESLEAFISVRKNLIEDAKEKSKKALATLKKDYEDKTKQIQKLEAEQLEAEKTASSATLKALKETYTEETKAIKNAQSEALDTEKELSKEVLEGLKETNAAEVEAIRQNQKDLIAAEQAATKATQASYKEQIEAIKAEVSAQTAAVQEKYKALTDTQSKYQEAFKTASSQMLHELSEAMSDYQKEAEALVNNTINGITSAYDEQISVLEGKQSKLTSKLESIGSLFKVSGSGVMTMDDLREEAQQIRDYADKLQRIREEVSEELFDEITDLDIKEGNAYMDMLFGMSKEELAEYTEAYKEMKEAARGSAAGIYGDDMLDAADEYQRQLDEAFKNFPKQLNEIGQRALEGFVDGLTKNTDYMDENVRTFVSGMINEFKSLLKISSPSRAMEKLGQYTGEGFGEGIRSMISEVKARARELADAASMPVEGISGSISGFGGSRGRQMYGQQIVNNYNLVQNNTSPKSLTALDTFQARRRQIAMIKQYA